MAVWYNMTFTHEAKALNIQHFKTERWIICRVDHISSTEKICFDRHVIFNSWRAECVMFKNDGLLSWKWKSNNEFCTAEKKAVLNKYLMFFYTAINFQSGIHNIKVLLY